MEDKKFLGKAGVRPVIMWQIILVDRGEVPFFSKLVDEKASLPAAYFVGLVLALP